MNNRWDDTGACRACGKCPVANESLHHYSGVDPCLGVLADVVQACCGHGFGIPYVVIAPGNPPGTMIPMLEGPHTTHRGQDALAYFAAHGVGPAALAAVA